MCDLPEGNYRLLPAGFAAPPPFPIGANVDEGPSSPVIVDGKDKVWFLGKREHGNYVLTLQQDWGSKGIENNVVVETAPLPALWAIRSQHNKAYTIEVPSVTFPTRTWTVESTDPGTKVTLAILELARPGQVWNFIPVPKD